MCRDQVAKAIDEFGMIAQGERADTQNQQGHDPGQGIHAEGQFKVQAGNPRQDFFYAATGIYGAVLEDQPDESGCGDGGQHVERISSK